VTQTSDVLPSGRGFESSLARTRAIAYRRSSHGVLAAQHQGDHQRAGYHRRRRIVVAAYAANVRPA
jgi:hypothetical protein